MTASTQQKHFPPDRYYLALAAAFVRGQLPTDPALDDSEVVDQGARAGLRLHKFKRSTLRRVQRVLGALRGLYPSSLLDVGSGRGTFLWPLLDGFPDLPVTALDALPQRVTDLQAVTQGGVSRLKAYEGSVLHLEDDDDHYDGATILEVLEHLEDPGLAAREVVRVARRFVIASVPSKADDNPQHIQLFTKSTLTELFLNAGAKRVSVEFVLNHMIAVVGL